jgi:hypothetical protein
VTLSQHSVACKRRVDPHITLQSLSHLSLILLISCLPELVLTLKHTFLGCILSVMPQTRKRAPRTPKRTPKKPRTWQSKLAPDVILPGGALQTTFQVAGV